MAKSTTSQFGAHASPRSSDRMESPSSAGRDNAPALIVRDSQGCIPLSRVVSEGDDVVLLTPVVRPLVDRNAEAREGSVSPGTSTQALARDPFETLGRALTRHPLRLKVHHVPYTVKGGIHSTHIEIIHMKHAKLVIFVVSGPSTGGQPSQVDMAAVISNAASDLPQVVLACCNVRELGRLETNAMFPTIVQIQGYSLPALDSAISILFQGWEDHRQIHRHLEDQDQREEHQPQQLPQPNSPHQPHQQQQQLQSPQQGSHNSVNMQNLMLSPRQWDTEVYVPQRDMDAVHKLWSLAMGEQYSLTPFQLRTLLDRDGYAMHLVVREPESGELVGFCATYTTYVNNGDERLLGSLAAIIVRPEYRRRGVGRSLHDRALAQLKRTRGVCRLQLGSTCPRLLFGLPIGSPSEDWFRRRGWELDQRVPGQGQEACDWILNFNQYPQHEITPSGLQFRPCEPRDYEVVLELVSHESMRNNNSGWYDQYLPVCSGHDIRDIVVGTENDVVIATALTYLPFPESSVAKDLPWAGTISREIGGVTCICIADDMPGIRVTRDAIMLRLLDACVNSLKDQGMHGMFLDAVKGGDEGFQVMGFQKWARYRDVWRSV